MTDIRESVTNTQAGQASTPTQDVLTVADARNEYYHAMRQSMLWGDMALWFEKYAHFLLTIAESTRPPAPSDTPYQ